MNSPSNAEVPPDLTHPNQTTGKRRVYSAMLSAALPGAGHLSLGNRQAGIGFACAFCILTFMYWPLRLPRSYVALQVLTFALMGLCTVAGWHALRTPSQRASQGSRVWLVLLIPFALLVSFAHSNWLFRAAGVRPFGVPSTAMEPTILKGDRIVVDLRGYRDSKAKSRDVIVIVKTVYSLLSA